MKNGLPILVVALSALRGMRVGVCKLVLLLALTRCARLSAGSFLDYTPREKERRKGEREKTLQKGLLTEKKA